jgi:hypothetical protein
MGSSQCELTTILFFKEECLLNQPTSYIPMQSITESVIRYSTLKGEPDTHDEDVESFSDTV